MLITQAAKTPEPSPEPVRAAQARPHTAIGDLDLRPGQAHGAASRAEGAVGSAADQGAGMAKGAAGQAKGAARDAAGQVPPRLGYMYPWWRLSTYSLHCCWATAL